MTDPRATTTPTSSTAAASRDVDDIGFSVHELQYLLSISPGDSADRTAELLNVAPVPNVDETILVGGASLLSSGRLEISAEGSFLPTEGALIVAFILSTSHRWTVITGATDDAVDLRAFAATAPAKVALVLGAEGEGLTAAAISAPEPTGIDVRPTYEYGEPHGHFHFLGRDTDPAPAAFLRISVP